MSSSANHRPTAAFVPENPLAALFLLAYPSVAVLVHGGASSLFLAAVVVSLVALARRGPHRLDGHDFAKGDLALCIALAGPLTAVIISSAWHGHVVPRTWDSPSRFVAAIPLFLVLRRQGANVLKWADLSFSFGAIASFAVAVLSPRDWGVGRAGSSFLNPIHFGDIALVLGVLSIISLNWWRKDSRLIRLLKIVAFAAGLGATLLSGSRGAWVAVPVVALFIVVARGRGRSWQRNALVLLAVVVALAATYALSSNVRGRMGDISTDIASYSHGNKDTPVGIRLQLYAAALTLIERQPVFGAGDEGFADDMQSLARQHLITPVAAEFGEGETHNQLLAYTANYGLVGGIMLLGIYVVPIWYFCIRLDAPCKTTRRAALMGLAFVVSFLIFGMTVETFDLKSTVCFYAAVAAVLAAVASDRGLPGETAARADRHLTN
ncbi:MAG TPA: O-antigen ligase family protein [Paraburkholderia sp.]